LSLTRLRNKMKQTILEDKAQESAGCIHSR
jgi:hypothetical protein